MSANKTVVVAELSANHNHRLDIALETIRAAARSGADAIKLQTYTADTLTLNCRNEDFLIHGGLWDGYCLYDLYKEAYTPWEWHAELYETAKKEGLLCFSTPFDKTAVDFLEDLGNPIYKIASFEITDIPLIRYIASKHKPVVLSTGIATTEDIELAVNTIREEGCDDITLLKCTSAYPAPIEQANLLTMDDMRKRFGVKVGLSDHTTGADVAVAAVALGAEMVEKHFIIDRSIGGPDSAFSMQQDEFAAMVERIRLVEKALGNVVYPTEKSPVDGRKFARSLYVAQDIEKGQKFTEQNIRSVRPSYGLPPVLLPEIIGKTASRNLEKGERLTEADIREGL